MGMSVHLFPVSLVGGVYCGATCYELTKWNDVLDDIVNNDLPLDRAVQIPWVCGELKLRSAEDVDHECTWLITAETAKCLTYYEKTWSPALIYAMKKIEECINALPDDSLLIAFYV
jgi:hypothetical protein